MKLSKVKLCGFKSFDKEMIIEINDLTAIIGKNSSGKTSFFYALLRMFGESGQDREIKKSDFYFPNNVNPDTVNSRKLHIETTFTFEEINQEGEIKKYSIPNFIENFIIDNKKDNPYIRVRLEATWKKSNQPEGIVEKKIFFVVCNNDKFDESNTKPISKEILSKIKFIYVPAVRNPYSQLRNVSGSILWRLLNSINISDDFKVKVNSKINEVNKELRKHDGIKKVNGFVEGEWKRYHTDDRYESVEFAFNTSDIDSILNKIEPSFTPTEIGNSYGIDDIGDGLKSLFYFSLVGTLLKVEEETIKEILSDSTKEKDERVFSVEPPYITIMGVEEPENHISPYILGKIIKNLHTVSENVNSQVILSSHSASIIKRIDPENIRYFNISRDSLSTKVNSIILPDNKEQAFKYVKEAIQSYPELYFSNLVIFGEGDSEEVVIPEMLKAYGIDTISSEIAVIPLGGRHVNHFWRLMNQLDIPYITLLDLDLERGGGGFGRIKYVIEQLLENGVEYKNLLTLKDGQVLSKDAFKKMHEWDEVEFIDEWTSFLRGYNVYFSDPIDLDFMMLKHFEESYRGILNQKEGPTMIVNNKKVFINEATKLEIDSDEYTEKLEEAIHATLKNKDKDGANFTTEEKRLMLWYQYFFLYRGKPVIHRLALNSIKQKDLKDKMPEVFKELSGRVEKMLLGGR